MRFLGKPDRKEARSRPCHGPHPLGALAVTCGDERREKIGALGREAREFVGFPARAV